MKNKKVYVLIISLLIVFVLTSNVLGASVKCPLDNCNNTLDMIYPDGFNTFIPTDDGTHKHVNNIFLVKLQDDYYIVVTCSYEDNHKTEKLYIDNDTLATTPGCYMYAYFKYNFSNNNWDYIGWNGNMSSFLPNVVQNATFVSSTTTIYTDSNLNKIFFQATPLRVAIAPVEVEENKEIAKEIAEVLQLILVVVVSFLGLRKALSWLSTLLRHS